MRRLVITFVALGLLGCGQADKSEPDVVAALAPAFAQFKSRMDQAEISFDRKRISEIAVVGAADWNYESIVGICYTSQVQRMKYTKIKMAEQRGRIEILETNSIDAMNVTLVHELGHCIFGLGHSEEESSIMYPAADYSAFPDLTSALDGLVRELKR
jgi:predicted Zn-dependent protease